MVIARRNIGGQRAKRVERGFVAPVELLVHILFDQLHRHMARPLNHHLHIMFPSDLRQLAKGFQLAQLRRVIGIPNRARAQPVAERERHIIGFHNLADFFKMRVQKAFLVMGEAPFGHNRATA